MYTWQWRSVFKHCVSASGKAFVGPHGQILQEGLIDERVALGFGPLCGSSTSIEQYSMSNIYHSASFLKLCL